MVQWENQTFFYVFIEINNLSVFEDTVAWKSIFISFNSSSCHLYSSFPLDDLTTTNGLVFNL